MAPQLPVIQRIGAPGGWRGQSLPNDPSMIPGHVIGEDSARSRANSFGNPVFYPSNKYRSNFSSSVNNNNDVPQYNGLNNLSKSFSFLDQIVIIFIYS